MPPALNRSGPPPLARLRQIQLHQVFEASSTQLDRLGLLRAWLRDKPFEVLDEPTAFLNAQAADQVRSVIRERALQRLMLISSHDLELLAQADQVITVQPSPASLPATAPARNA